MERGKKYGGETWQAGPQTGSWLTPTVLLILFLIMRGELCYILVTFLPKTHGPSDEKKIRQIPFKRYSKNTCSVLLKKLSRLSKSSEVTAKRILRGHDSYM
jgi:hypothetical protein